MEEDPTNNKPKVSIGLPVYNGENYLKEAIDSILTQTFTDFELIISDNASEDRTHEICQTYAAKDPRIRYYRFEQNQGAARNFNHVFELSCGVYFKWAAHDDIIASDYISKCVDVLDKDESIVLCNSKVKFIDNYGNIIEDYNISSDKANSKKPADRFGYLILFDHWCFDVFGLIRSEALKKTSLIKAYPGSDRALLVELCLIGRFYEIPQYLFFNRDHSERSIRALQDNYSRADWFDPTKDRKVIRPNSRIFFEYLKAINRFSLGLNDMICCYGHMGNWLRFYSRRIVKELLMTIGFMFNSTLRYRNLKTKNKK